MQTHGPPLRPRTARALVGVHLVLPPAVPLAADLPDDLDAIAVLPGAVSHFRSDRVVPLEPAAFCCPDDNGTTTLDPRPRRSGDALPGKQPPDVVRLSDGGTARLLACLDQSKSHMRILKCKAKARSCIEQYLVFRTLHTLLPWQTCPMKSHLMGSV